MGKTKTAVTHGAAIMAKRREFLYPHHADWRVSFGEFWLSVFV
jgi:hypothetical protein